MCIRVYKFGAVDIGGRKGRGHWTAHEYKTNDMHDCTAIKTTIEN
jgi:hypothetical protein